MKLVKIHIVILLCLLLVQTVFAQFSLNSGAQWKVTGQYEPGWLNPDFDDSGWINATSPHNKNSLPSVAPGVVESMWIRPYYTSPGGNDSVYCRFTFELRSLCIDVEPFEIRADDEWYVFVNGVYINGARNANIRTLTGINQSAFKIGKNVICIIGVNGKVSSNPPGPHHLSCKGAINYTSGPIIDLGADKFVCDGDTTLVTVNHQYQSYLWNDGQTTRTAEFSKKDKYWCTARDTAGCAWIDTVEVDIYKVKRLDLGPDTSICEGDLATFDADPDTSYTKYKWSTGDSSRFVSVGYQDLFSVTVTDKNGCNSKDSRRVRVFVSGTAVNLGEDTVLCRGDSMKLNAFFPQSKYRWSDGSRDSLFTISRPGIYEVTVTNFCGNAIDEIRVDYINELNVDLGEDLFLCSNLQIELGQKVPGAISYDWNTGDTSTFIKTTIPGVYKVHVVDYCGNEGFDEVEVIKGLKEDAIIPTAFSPNNDALNETWRTYIRPKSYFELKVIDQWSRVVFESDDPTIEWDGTNEGGPLPIGKYIYVVKWDECLNQPQTAQGEVHIVR